MNWKRPVKNIKVKAYNEEIFVDKCIAGILLFIDSLPHTKTLWGCCHHGLHNRNTQIEFETALKLRPIKNVLIRSKWINNGVMKGWTLSLPICKCSLATTKKAKKHFKM